MSLFQSYQHKKSHSTLECCVQKVLQVPVLIFDATRIGIRVELQINETCVFCSKLNASSYV
jgi:hypothetical protein